MCGIAGLVAPDLPTAERLALVARMVRVLRHRGPSGEAVWADDRAALGIARLAIVAPNQPARVLASEDGAVHGVANGELYNHGELLAALRERGHTIADGPDTAVFPHLWEEHGERFAERLDGMFAVALWDARRDTLVLARDRAGEKPLFTCEANGRLAFASEPAALLALPWVSADPDPAALGRYLVHGYFCGEDSAYAALRTLPPAHRLVWRGGLAERQRWWRPWDALAGPRPDTPGTADAPERVREALADAVRSRVPGEVPFGVFLSGGVDSGFVATLAARAVGHAFPTFSLRLPHRGYDESALAREVARSIGSEHHEVVLDAEGGEEALLGWAANMDQPLGDPSVLPTWALARYAARHVPVVLTGEGGDELFGGYPTYLGHRHARLADALPEPLARAALALARRFRPKHHHVTIAHMVERFLGVRGQAPYERHLAWFGTSRPAEASALLAPAMRPAPGSLLAPARALEAALAPLGLDPRARDGLVPYQLLDFETYLPGDLLTKVDRCTMAHGLESRAPFLRASLMMLALGLPDGVKLRGTSGKWALKQAARGVLPDAVLDRRKQGFSPPFSAWARGPLRGLVVDLLSPARIERAGVLDSGAVHALLGAHLSGVEDRGRTLWAILSLQMWAEQRDSFGARTALPAEAAVPATADVAR